MNGTMTKEGTDRLRSETVLRRRSAPSETVLRMEGDPPFDPALPEILYASGRVFAPCNPVFIDKVRYST